MKRKSRFLALAAATVIAVVAPGASAQDAAGGSKDAKSASSSDMHAMMMKGMKEMQGMKPSGNMDHDFAILKFNFSRSKIRQRTTRYAKQECLLPEN